MCGGTDGGPGEPGRHLASGGPAGGRRPVLLGWWIGVTVTRRKFPGVQGCVWWWWWWWWWWWEGVLLVAAAGAQRAVRLGGGTWYTDVRKYHARLGTVACGASPACQTRRRWAKAAHWAS